MTIVGGYNPSDADVVAASANLTRCRGRVVQAAMSGYRNDWLHCWSSSYSTENRSQIVVIISYAALTHHTWTT